MSAFGPGAGRAGGGEEARVLKSQMRVTAIEDGWIQLQGERGASCSACAAKPGCGSGDLLGFSQRSPPRICVPAAVSAAGRPAVGDEVVVSISGTEFLHLTVLAYLLPAAALAATACLAALAGLGDVQAAILALCAFALSFLPLRRRERAGGGLTTLTIAETLQTAGRDRTAACAPAAPYPANTPRNGNRE